MGGVSPRWPLRPRDWQASRLAVYPHGHGARGRAMGWGQRRHLGRSPVCAGGADQPSRPLKPLPSTVQWVPFPVVYRLCNDDGYGKT